MSDAQASRDAALAMVESADRVEHDHPNGHELRTEYLAEAQVHATLACAAATAEAGPLHETICPSCGAHIRARMADASGPRLLINADVVFGAEALREELAGLLPPGSYDYDRFARVVLQSTGLLR